MKLRRLTPLLLSLDEQRLMKKVGASLALTA